MTAWMDDAHCTNPLWPSLDLDAQREVCAACPVRDQCRTLGISTLLGATTGEVATLITSHDLWGGHTLRELHDTLPTTCIDCDKPIHRRGRCQYHYHQQRNRGKTCTFRDCGRQVHATGLCKGHYDQKLSGSDMRPIRRAAISPRDAGLIRALRREGCTNVALAQRFGVSRQSISEITAGRAHPDAPAPDPETVEDILADMLGKAA